MAIIVNDNFRVNAPKPIDERYLRADLTPYTSVAEVNATLPFTRRHIGLVVNINNVEYWYNNGINDTNLVIKTGSSTSKEVFNLIADGINSEFTFTHSQGNRNYSITVQEDGGNYNKIIVDVYKPTINTFTISFGYIPTINYIIILI